MLWHLIDRRSGATVDTLDARHMAAWPQRMTDWDCVHAIAGHPAGECVTICRGAYVLRPIKDSVAFRVSNVTQQRI
jgi:hypothetical protein